MIELDADLILERDLIAQEYCSVPKVIKAVRMQQPFFLNTLEGRKSGKTGDWLLIFADKSRDIMTDAQFQKNYARIMEQTC